MQQSDVVVRDRAQVQNNERESIKKPIILSLIAIVCIMPVVIFLLQASGYAGTMDDTQLGFNADIIKYYFSLLTAEGMTLFRLGNLADYVFILSYGTGFYYSTRYLSWNYKDGGLPKKISSAFTWIGVSSAICDGIENIFLFLMTFNPTSFPSWFAITHSLFASLKFMMMYATFGWLILSIILNKTFLRAK